MQHEHHSRTRPLSAIDEDTWQRLKAACAGQGAGWRLPALATTSSSGCVQRTIVLRAVSIPQRWLLFHTDRRSAKITEIRKNPRISLLFYDHEQQLQLQILGRASIHESDEVAEELWRNSTDASLKMYLAPLPPGTSRTHADVNLPDFAVGKIPRRDEIEPGMSNFAVIRVTAESADWLQLSRDGNIRARFSYPPELPAIAEWLTP